ncbi:MAG: phosphatase PAP2 family protein [Myxococcales bacterium]
MGRRRTLQNRRRRRLLPRRLPLAAWALLAGLLALLPTRHPVCAEEAGPSTRRVEWSPQWRRFRAWEYGATAAAGAGAFAIHYYQPQPAHPYWHGANPFDDAVRDWLRLDTRAGRTQANTVSNVLWLGGSVVPFVTDLPVALLVYRQRALSGQLLLMDLEATAISQLVNNALLWGTGRARPSYESCLADPAYGSLCGTSANNVSFPSGHVMTVATAAGLTCVHHRYLPLYGSAAADAGACIFMSLATLGTGTSRIMADHHRATDVLVGAGLGFGIGYGLPWLLHYRAQAGSADSEGDRPGVVIVPFGAPGTLGVGLVGSL